MVGSWRIWLEWGGKGGRIVWRVGSGGSEGEWLGN
jgi:hypothetical protein